MSERNVGIVLHPTRPEAIDVAAAFVVGIAERGIASHVIPDPVERLDQLRAKLPDHIELGVLGDEDPGCELLVVFGGDGSILGGAEWALPRDVPVLGVNLGHVGFLAELEISEVGELVDQVSERDYEVERRLTLHGTVLAPDGTHVWDSFAVNELSVEKGSREKMIEVMATVDHRALSRWGCDGVLVATPTGSTAYAFSAGGPVMWPDLEAMLLVPLLAHALFAKPLVLSPESRVDLDVSVGHEATVWADGRRGIDVAPGSRVTVVRCRRDLLIARLSEQPFTTRLVKKFRLPVEGFRGGDEAQR